MANNQPLLAPDMQQLQDRIALRQQLAGQLMQRGTNADYSTQMAGGFAVQRSPWEALANIGSALVGAKMASQSANDKTALAQAMQRQKQQQFESMYAGGQQPPAAKPQASLAQALLSQPQVGNEESALIPQMQQQQSSAQSSPIFVTGSKEGDMNLYSQNPDEYFKAWNAKNNPEFSTSPEFDEQGRAYVLNKAGGKQYIGSKRQEEMVNDNGVLRSKYGTTPLGVIPNVNEPFNPVIKDGVITSAPNMPVQNFQITRAVAGSPKQQTMVNLPKVEQSALVYGNEDFIKNSYRPLMVKAQAAGTLNNQLESLRNIPAKTGWGAETMAKAANILVGLGLGTDEAKAAATNAQTFNSIVGQQVYTGLNAATGPQTEGDAIRYKQTLANLGNTPEANQFILDSAKAFNNLTMKQAKYYSENMPKARASGDLTQVEQGWIEQSDKNSIWNDPIMAKWKKPISAAPSGGKQSGSVIYNPATKKWEAAK